MYIVQIKNPQRFSWKELPETNCKFDGVEDARKLYVQIRNSANYAGMEVRVWSTESEHRVEF